MGGDRVKWPVIQAAVCACMALLWASRFFLVNTDRDEAIVFIGLSTVIATKELLRPKNVVYSHRGMSVRSGWGWLPLLLIVGPLFNDGYYANTLFNSMVISSGSALSVAVYFLARLWLFRTAHYKIKGWLLSFQAGAVAFVSSVYLVLLADHIDTNLYGDSMVFDKIFLLTTYRFF